MKLTSLVGLMSGAQAFGDMEKTSIAIPKIGTDVTMRCEGTQMIATMSRDYIKNNEQWLGNGEYVMMGISDITQSEADVADCKGKRDADGNIVLTIDGDFTKCGTRVEAITETFTEADGTESQRVKEYVFVNNIVNDVDADNFMLARTLDILEFRCVYPTVQMTTGEINPLVQSALAKSKTKEIRGDMRLYKSENYTDFYTEPPVMNLDDILYVEVNLERPLVSDAFAASTDFAVVLEHCWGTPYNDRSGEMKYFIIKNQCPVRGDPSLKVESNGDSLTGRFNIKMFKFLGDELNDVWLHCTVRACNTTAASCVPDCDSSEDARSKRSTRRELPFVSLGHELNADLPIQRKLEGIDEEILIIDERSAGELGAAKVALVIVGAIVCLLMFVFGLTCMVQRRRRGGK